MITPKLKKSVWVVLAAAALTACGGGGGSSSGSDTPAPEPTPTPSPDPEPTLRILGLPRPIRYLSMRSMMIKSISSPASRAKTRTNADSFFIR